MSRKPWQNGSSSHVLERIDRVTFGLFLALVIIGWLMIYSVSYEEVKTASSWLDTSAGKQLVWIGICAFIFGFIMLVDAKFWQVFAYPIYFISLSLLFLVLFLGTNIKGATSWFSFGGFSFQPSELAKFGTSLALSAYLSNYSTNLQRFRHQLIAFSFIVPPIFLILLQPDAGSALVFLSFFLVLYRQGLSASYYIVGISSAGLLLMGLVYDPGKITLMILLGALFILAYNYKEQLKRHLMIGLGFLAIGAYFLLNSEPESLFFLIAGAGVLFLTLSFLQYQNRNGRLALLLGMAFIAGTGLVFASNYAFNNVLKPHQQDRINVWLQPDKCDERGSLYNLIQSKTAIGSGGLSGKGFLQGTMTRLNYVPEQSTDFIFCTIGEEQGFIGVLAVLVLFVLLLYRITILAERQRSVFSRSYAYCIAGIIFLHFFINIAMTMGIMPIIGIPLPFISKGGSSLLGFTIMIAVLIKLDKHRL
ncbi:MAG TPA: rod shape-determining protein RodA [Saprospiraceae bacterium]|nr:rod shape-determining protein RodA [Saprospiraceae bacterium]HMQ82025.1 rod shape-determining protein RodA [Saprospiraceae bacterium]